MNKYIKDLAVDIMCYARENNPFDFTEEEWFSITIDTYEELEENRLEHHIGFFEEELKNADDLEEYQVDCAQSILNRLINLKLNEWNMIMENVKKSFQKTVDKN